MYASTSQNSMGGPVVCVGVEALDLKGSCIRLIGQLMDHDPLLVFSDNTDLQQRRERWLIKRWPLEVNVQCKLVLYYLSLYQPAWDGCFAVIAWFELQGYWTRADVRDGNVGRGSRHLYGNRRGKACKMNGWNGSVGKLKALGTILLPFTHNTSCWIKKKWSKSHYIEQYTEDFYFPLHAYLPCVLWKKNAFRIKERCTLSLFAWHTFLSAIS